MSHDGSCSVGLCLDGGPVVIRRADAPRAYSVRYRVSDHSPGGRHRCGSPRAARAGTIALLARTVLSWGHRAPATGSRRLRAPGRACPEASRRGGTSVVHRAALPESTWLARVTPSVELIPASSGRRVARGTPLADGLAAQQAGSLPQVPAGGTPLLRTVRHGEAMDPSGEWFRVPLERSTPLPLDRLKFPWCRYARSGITVGELLARETLRPDLLRVRKVYEAGRGEEASLVLVRLLAEGDRAAYQIPAAIVSDRTFAYSLAEVEYVDRMADYLHNRDPKSPREFVLSTVAGLYVSPRPFAYSKARVALQKSACSLMRLHHVAIAPRD